MADSKLMADVTAVSWAGAANASARERAQEENGKLPKARRRPSPSAPDADAANTDTNHEQTPGGAAHEIDSFA